MSGPTSGKSASRAVSRHCLGTFALPACRRPFACSTAAFALAALLAVVIPAAPGADQVRPEAAYPAPVDPLVARGVKHLIDLKLDKAIGSFTPALIACARQPLSNVDNARRAADVLILIGRAFQFDENDLAASQALALACALDPDNVLARALLAEELARQGRHDETGVLYDALRTLAPTNPLAARAVATHDLRSGLYLPAIERLEQAVRIQPNDAWTQYTLARALNQAGFTTRAASVYRRAAGLELSAYNKRLLLSSAETCSQRYDKAKDHLIAAGRVLPDDPLWHTKLANLLFFRESDDDSGARELWRAVDCRRFYTRAFTSLALYLGFNNRFEEALRCLDYAEKRRPWSAEIATVRGQIYQLKGDGKRAEQAYRQAIRLNSENTVAYQNLGGLIASRGDDDEALTTYRECLSHCPGWTQAWRYIGDIYRSKGKWGEALAAYQKAPGPLAPRIAELGPQAQANIAQVIARIGACHYNAGRSDEAAAQARLFNKYKRLSRRPDYLPWVLLRPERLKFEADKPQTGFRRAVSHVALADMLLETGDFEGACREYRHAIRLDPNNVDWHMCYLSALIDKKDWGEAIKEDVVLANKLMARAPQLFKKWQKRLTKVKDEPGASVPVKPPLAPQQ